MKERIICIDILKGIAILLIVYGHIIPGTIPFLTEYVSTFHIPLFLFVSGLLFNNQKYSNCFWNFFLARIKSLGIPFVSFSIIIAILYCLIENNYHVFIKTLLSMGWGGYALWFIPVLFVSELVYFPISLLRKPFTIAILAVMATLSYISAQCIGLVSNNILFVFCGVFYFGIGNISKTFLEYIRFAGNKNLFVLTILSLFLSLSYMLFTDELPEWFINKIPSLFFYLTPIFSICSLLCLSIVFEHVNKKPINSFFIICGRQSFIILAFHQILCMILQQYLPSKLAILSMLFILSGLVYAIPKYCPWLLGKLKTV